MPFLFKRVALRRAFFYPTHTTMNTYSEKQNFRSWWLWTLIGVVDAIIAYAIVLQLIMGTPIGTHPAPDGLLIVLSLLLLSINLLVWSSELELRLDAQGVSFRYPPFIRRERNIDYGEISELYVRQYSPIVEYGGWGYRMGLMGKGKALNVKGNQGLQIVFSDGKKLLLGTQHPEELRLAINEFAPSALVKDQTKHI